MMGRMELPDIYNGGIQYSSAGFIVPLGNKAIDICLRFYRAKFHFIVIPAVIIIAAIHLKYAIQYLGQCPIQPLINIYLIVQASVALSVVLLALVGMIIAHCINFRSERGNNKIIAYCLILFIVILQLILLLFNLAWLVAGSVWIFGAKSNGEQGSDPSATTTYCQSKLYRAAFVLIIINYAFHAFIVLVLIFRCIYIYWKRGRNVPYPVVAMNRI